MCAFAVFWRGLLTWLYGKEGVKGKRVAGIKLAEKPVDCGSGGLSPRYALFGAAGSECLMHWRYIGAACESLATLPAALLPH